MRQALGRGLDALIPSGTVDGVTQQSIPVRMIPISSIRPNHLQPRKHFDPERLSELAQSIKEHGLAQPIIVSLHGDTNTYELIAGERRLRASELAGLTEIEAIVRTPSSDKERLAISLIENLQREDLNPIEEALGYLRLMKEFGISQTQLSEVIGKSKSSISNTLRLLDLPEEIQKALHFNQLSEGHARALLSIENPLERHKLFKIILEQGLSVRDVESYCQRIQGGEIVPEKPTSRPPAVKRSADEKAMEESLQKKLGTRVDIRQRNGSARGSIVLHYYSLEDFDRLVTILNK